MYTAVGLGRNPSLHEHRARCPTTIQIEDGLDYDAVDDIEYLRNRLMASLRVPKAFLGYEEGLGSKATLAAEDVRFARTIERLQRITVSELTKIAIVHLYAQGFTDEELVNFELTLTNPSTIYEQEKLELWGNKVNLARDVKDNALLPTDWVYKNVFNFSDEEITNLTKEFSTLIESKPLSVLENSQDYKRKLWLEIKEYKNGSSAG